VTVLLPRTRMYGCVAPTLIRALAKGLLRIQLAEVEDVCLLLGVSRTECLPVWEGLVQDGWIVQKGGQWRPAERIRDLANARIGAALPRAKADMLLATIVNNACRMNQLPATQEDVFWVTKLAVFGSYLSEKEQLGDLDIAWSTAPRAGTEAWFAHRLATGKDPMAKTRGMLCPRSPYVKLAGFAEMLALACPYRLVYEFAPSVRRSSRGAPTKG
jgi:hypothetical protein